MNGENLFLSAVYDEFFDQVLSLQGVRDLYAKIDEETNGLAKVLQNELSN